MFRTINNAFLAAILATTLALPSMAQAVSQTKGSFEDKFRQLDEVWPTPNDYRTASGAPGHEYWQQRADYKIEATLDETNRRLHGFETITYTNNSPDELRYIWVQLDQNKNAKHAPGYMSEAVTETDRISYGDLRRRNRLKDFEGGHKILEVKDENGKTLPHKIVDTMMRIDLPAPLKNGESTIFSIKWFYNITEVKVLWARGGYEHFEEDGNDIFTIAQWYPRVVAYTDVNGWHHKQFLGRGEFTLEFGDYDLKLTVPSDHILAASGVLRNPEEVLTEEQRRKLKEAETADRPVIIVSEEEATRKEKTRAKGTKTWHFIAENVRDVAFATSRKYIWDAQGYYQKETGNTIMAHSVYPKEGNPLWEHYSTAAIIHTIEIYDRFTFPYPYPVAISCNGPVGGMEYPMISFNGPRTERDKETGDITYTRGTKHFLIGVVIHEVGHNYFPMIVNSDERQWTWMDEGLNSFLDAIAQHHWERDYPDVSTMPRDITDYMRSQNQVPIMTNSESIQQFGPNAYAKPATALMILRETVLGRELFDFAFKEYARRWKFKRPYPADFFRTMEDASGVDLDWFWRGWFYSTDHTDIAITNVIEGTIETKNPEIEEARKRKEKAEEPESLTAIRDKDYPTLVEKRPNLADFYSTHDEFTVTDKQRDEYKEMLEGMEDKDKELLGQGGYFYFLEFENIGGLVMPVINSFVLSIVLGPLHLEL